MCKNKWNIIYFGAMLSEVQARIWSHSLKKSFKENFIFCAVNAVVKVPSVNRRLWRNQTLFFLLLFQWYISDFHCGKGVNLNWFTTLLKYYRQPKKYLQSDWSRRIQYWPDCIFGPNIALFDKRNKKIRFSLPEKIEIYSLKLNE